MTPKRLAALGLVAGLVAGGTAGFALGVPGFAGAQSDESTVTTEAPKADQERGLPGPARAAREGWIREALEPLVTNNTLSREQADAVVEALAEARPGLGKAHRGGFGRLDAAAEVLGMTLEDLRSALREGQTLAQVAEGRGVDAARVVEALTADHRARVTEKVASGEITQDQADRLLSGLTERARAFVDGESRRPGPPAWGWGRMGR